MVIRVPRPYLTFNEVAERLQVPVESTDMRRVVLAGVLRARLIVRQQLPRARAVGGGLAPVFDADGAPVTDQVEGWVYAQWPLQSAPFEATFAAASRVANPTDADELWLWPDGPTVSNLLTHAVVAEEDLNDAEAVLTAGGDLIDDDKPNPKRQDSIAKLITVMAYSGYKWRRNARRTDVVAQIVGDGDRIGIDISRGTVLELLRLAWDASGPTLPADGPGEEGPGDPASGQTDGESAADTELVGRHEPSCVSG